MTIIVGHTTRASGTILTSTIYNADHVNHVTNAINLNADKVEGAAPPVVDGHAVLWNGTSGVDLKTAGFVPVTNVRQIITAASGGLSGGGDLTADRTLALILASQAEAEAGTENTKATTSLRVRQAIDNRVPTLIDLFTIGALLTINTTGVDTTVPAADGSIFYVTGGTTWSISTNGGTDYALLGVTGTEGGIVFVRGVLVATMALNGTITRLSTIGGAGNIFFKVASGSGSALKVAQS